MAAEFRLWIVSGRRRGALGRAPGLVPGRPGRNPGHPIDGRSGHGQRRWASDRCSPEVVGRQTQFAGVGRQAVALVQAVADGMGARRQLGEDQDQDEEQVAARVHWRNGGTGQ